MGDLRGTNLGRYAVIEQIGRGGMATVYKAFDTQLERPVAIKVLLQHEEHSPQFLARFKREAKTLALLSHPNVVKILDYGDQDGLPFLVLDYIPGGTLANNVDKPMHWQRAAEILAPIARALQYVHDHGVIHRDVKSSNILLSESGEPMLSDFGIAKILQYHETVDLTQPGVGVGTPEYMAPEQGYGDKIDFRADIYALGIVFYELLTGVHPYTAIRPWLFCSSRTVSPYPAHAFMRPHCRKMWSVFSLKCWLKTRKAVTKPWRKSPKVLTRLPRE